MKYEEELAFAKEIANLAGEIMKKYYRIDQQIQIKDDETPVTIADTEINMLLIDRVKAEFSDCGVLGEEDSWQADRKNLWVCDPIDGTVAYIMRVPTSMFSLAYVVDGKPVVAVAYNPWTEETYSAVIGEGTYRNSEKIAVSNKKWGAGVYIAGSNGAPGTDATTKKKLESRKIYVNEFPGGVAKGCLIAEGAIEARIFIHTGAHDIAALKLIIEEAGGKVTDLDGNEQRYDQPLNGAIMSNGLIHKELLELYANSGD